MERGHNFVQTSKSGRVRINYGKSKVAAHFPPCPAARHTFRVTFPRQEAAAELSNVRSGPKRKGLELSKVQRAVQRAVKVVKF